MQGCLEKRGPRGQGTGQFVLVRRATPSLSVVAVPFVILWFIPNSMWQARVSAMNSALNSGATGLVARKVEVQKRKIFSLAHIHKSRIFLSTCWTRFAEPMRAL